MRPELPSSKKEGLRDICSRLGVTKSGNKDELIIRIDKAEKDIEIEDLKEELKSYQVEDINLDYLEQKKKILPIKIR